MDDGKVGTIRQQIQPLQGAGEALGKMNLEFDHTGKVIRHRDYWDAAEELYARLPLLKWLMRALARQAAAPL